MDSQTTQEKASRKRRILIGLISSPLFVVIAGGVAMEWYRNHFEKPPEIHLPVVKVEVTASMNPKTETYRDNIFQAEGRYTRGKVDLDINNHGDKAGSDIYLEADFPQNLSVDKLSGSWGIEYKTHDGDFKPIERGQDWGDADHSVAFRIHELNPAIAKNLEIIFHYESVDKAHAPEIKCWDDGAIYPVTWQ